MDGMEVGEVQGVEKVSLAFSGGDKVHIVIHSTAANPVSAGFVLRIRDFLGIKDNRDGSTNNLFADQTGSEIRVHTKTK